MTENKNHSQKTQTKLNDAPSDKDLKTVAEQLGRPVRSVVSIAARNKKGEPLVITTQPRLENGEPFPTTFYITHPKLTSAISGLEAGGLMHKLNARLENEPELHKKYQKAHQKYLEARQKIADGSNIGDVPEIENITAGGMPTRVKCLHALTAQSLALGKGINPIGDLALDMIKDQVDL